MMKSLITFWISFLCFPTFINSFIVQNNVTAEPSSESNTTAIDDSSDKHDAFLKCPKWGYDPDEYLITDGVAYIEVLNTTYNSSFYYLDDNNTLYICQPLKLINSFKYDDANFTEVKFPVITQYITNIGLGISMACILVHLIIFVIVPDMRNMPGFKLASLCVSLFFGYLFYVCIFSESTKNIPSLCYASAVLTHFFFLSSFLWMSILALDVFLTVFNATEKLRTSSTQFQLKKYVYYALYSWGTALIFTTSSVIADNVKGLPVEYRPHFSENCWFQQKVSLLVFFAVPALVMICLNCICFVLSSIILFKNRMKTDKESQKSIVNGRIMLYFRLSIIMGVTWVIGVIAITVDTQWVWYLFVVLNTLQGLFIFLALTFTSKVQNHFRRLFHLPTRKESTQTASPSVFSHSMDKSINNVGKFNESQQ